ncbi:MAG: protein kinase [Thermoplasmata archaeon]|nr:protein kinase [Thermoplasmata archaeon]
MAESSQPVLFQSGRYVIHKKLGEGGKGIVYKALDTQLDRVVAIKLLKIEGLDEEALQRFRNEAQLAARLTHANIVAVYDIGAEAGRPFQVMELVDGQSLRGLLSSSQGPLAFPRALEIARDVARALAFAHGKGVLHRDVKPENIMLASDGTVKLMDFGLARAFDRPRLTAPGTMVGTPSYMAPENALGKESDERSDLYSLGAVFYEMATGRPLFRSEDSLKVIYSHIHDEPALPSRVNPRLPTAVDHVLLRLLAKNPGERYASAGDLERALTAIGKVSLPPESVEPPGPTSTTLSPLPHQATPEGQRIPTPEIGRSLPLVGREAEVASLKGFVDQVLRGDGVTVLIAGEAGIGKSRVTDEMRSYAVLRGLRTLVGHCHERERSAPYYPWIQMIRAFVADAPAAEVARLCGPNAADLAKLVPEIGEKVRLVAPSEAPDSPESQRLRMFDAVTRFFVEASQQSPLLLDVCDLHSGDSASVELFRHFARGLPRHFLLLVATYRDVEIEEGSTVARVLDDLHRERLSHVVALKRLSRAEVERMIGALFDQPVTPEFLDKVYERTGGNPFFVEEVLRSLVEEGILFRVGDRWERKSISEVSIPSSVRAVVARRLERLSDATQTLLRVAAILGNEFTSEALEETSGVNEGRVVEAIEQGLRHRLLREERLSAGRVAYRFTDPQVRDVLYDQTSSIRRRRYHRRAAEVLERSAGARAEQVAGELAHHYLLGGAVEQSFRYSGLAARRAARIYAHEEAIHHYQTALELMDELHPPAEATESEPVSERARLHAELSMEQTFLGQWAGAETNANAAARLFERVGDRAAAGLSLLHAGEIIYFELHRGEEGLAKLLQARTILENEPENRSHAELCLSLGYIAENTEAPQLPSSRALMERALAIARATGSVDVEVRTLVALTGLEPLSDADRVRSGLASALALAQKADSTEGPFVLHSLAWVQLVMEGDSTAALGTIDEGLRWSRRTRDRTSEASFEGTLLPAALTISGELDRAEANLATRRASGAEPSGWTDLVESRIALTRGDLDRAAALLDRWRKATPPGARWHDRLWQGYLEGELEEERGDSVRALAVMEPAIRLAEQKGYPAFRALVYSLLLARAIQVTLRLGEVGEAGEAERRVASYREPLDRIALQIPNAATEALALRSRGIWENHRGETREAIQTLEASVARWRQTRWPHELGETLYSLGTAYHKAGDRAGAARAFNEALDVFTRLKARRDIERVLGRKALLQA